MAQEDLFGEDYLYFHADDASDAAVRRDVDAIVELLACPPGSSILEVGCGEGRLLRELARRGYVATGVDRSRTMIEAAIANNARIENAVTYLIDDVRNMQAAQRFAAAFSWFTSFGYEDDAGNLEILRSIRRQLIKGGQFAIDVISKDHVLQNFQRARVVEKGDDFMIDRLTYDAATSRMRNDRIHIRAGVRRVAFCVRMYDRTELSELLSSAGFGSIRSLASGEPSSAGAAPRVRLVATAK